LKPEGDDKEEDKRWRVCDRSSWIKLIV